MATSGVNVKMGVSGVSQFRADIKKTQDSLKTLDESLKLNEKQFKQTGDAEEYMKTKSELLKGKIEGQKSVIDNCRKALEDMEKKGVDKSSKAFQQMQQQLLRAKGDLIDTENELNNIGTAGEEAGNGVDAMNTQLKRIGQGVSYQNVTDGLEKITGGMTKVVQKAWQMGEAIVKATLGAGSWADELKTTAAQYEIDPEQLQRMRKTANLIDTDVDTILSAQQKMRQGIGKKDKEALGAFAALFGEGYDPTKKNAVDAFWDAGEALMKLDDEYDKQVYAQKLFGKSWRELVPLFETGRKEYDKTMESWSVVENEQLDALGKMDDQYQKMTGEWETFKMEMLSAFSGPLTEGMETITGLFEELNEYLDTPEGQEMLTKLGETITSVIDQLINIDPETVIGGLSKVIEDVKAGFEWIDEHKEDVKNALLVIAGGFGALKLAEVALNVGRVVNGFKTIWHHNETAGQEGGGVVTDGGTGGTNGKSVVYTGDKIGQAAGSAVVLQMTEALIDNAKVLVDAEKTREEQIKSWVDAQVKSGFVNEKDREKVIEKNMKVWEAIEQLPEQLKKTQVDTVKESINDWILPDDTSSGEAMEFVQQMEQQRHEEQQERVQKRLDNVRWFNEVTDSLDRMNQINEETNEQNDKTSRNSLTSTDLSQFKGLPAAIARAVENANIRAEVDVVTAGTAMTPVMNQLLASMFRRDYT